MKTFHIRGAKLGSHIRLPDGREGTTVFNGLCGVGIKWGLHDPPPEDFENTSGDVFGGEPPTDWPWFAEAYLREHWPGADAECVGEDFEVIREGYGI